MFDFENQDKFKEQVVKWLRNNNYLDANGTLAGQVDYDVAYDMKSDIQNGTDIPDDEFDSWFDGYLLEDILLPLLRSLGAINEDDDNV